MICSTVVKDLSYEGDQRSVGDPDDSVGRLLLELELD